MSLARCLSAISELEKLFLSEAKSNNESTELNEPLTALKNRHDKIKTLLDDCEGMMDSKTIMSLFYQLEQKAVNQINTIALLSQTTSISITNHAIGNVLPFQKQFVSNLEQYHQWLEVEVIKKKKTEDAKRSASGRTAKSLASKKLTIELFEEKISGFIKNTGKTRHDYLKRRWQDIVSITTEVSDKSDGHLSYETEKPKLWIKEYLRNKTAAIPKLPK